MTLVVAFLASDSWVLASDTRLYETGFSLDPNTNQFISGTVTSSASKIQFDKESGIVFSFSGDGIGGLAGELLIDKLRSTDATHTRTLLNEVGNETFQKHIAGKSGINPALSRDLLIIFTKKNPVELWTLGIRASSIPAHHADKALIGDIANGAKLLWQLYYSPEQTCEQLRLLAAHTILMGHESHESLVAGLEMWWGNNQGTANPVEPTELRQLATRSVEIDKRIAKLFNAPFARLQRRTQII
ncbi:MAG: hypothetical protein WCE23_03695 [Candidatus Binatus sp.]|uniref:hypothetical protein n=1 Tax=Candidatus Binatus sp. TaxID=2811406 RepID=UPI003C715F44